MAMSLWEVKEDLHLLSQRGQLSPYPVTLYKEGISVFRAAELHTGKAEQKMHICEDKCWRCLYQECDQKNTAKGETGWRNWSLTQTPRRCYITQPYSQWTRGSWQHPSAPKLGWMVSGFSHPMIIRWGCIFSSTQLFAVWSTAITWTTLYAQHFFQNPMTFPSTYFSKEESWFLMTKNVWTATTAFETANLKAPRNQDTSLLHAHSACHCILFVVSLGSTSLALATRNHVDSQLENCSLLRKLPKTWTEAKGDCMSLEGHYSMGSPQGYFA